MTAKRKNSEIRLSDHFSLLRLFRFVIPSVCMMLFTSIYGVVDGYFVSNYAGEAPFAAINLIMPFLLIFSAVGFMVGSGGTALVAVRLGEGRKEEANRIFSMLVYLVIGAGAVMTLVGILCMKQVAILLGASTELLPYCVRYGDIIMLSLVPFMLQNLFQSFLIVAQKPKLGLALTVTAGVTNMVLDALFVGWLSFGVTGAAVATTVSQTVGGVIPLLYFCFPNSSLLRLGRTRFSTRTVLRVCTNGSSEFCTNISLSVVNMFYNKQLLRYIGQDGIAAYGMLMYVGFVFVAVYLGYSIGVAPLVGYHYGAQNFTELRNLFRKSLGVIAVLSLLMTVSSILLSEPLAQLFVGYAPALKALAQHALCVYSFSFLMCGFSIFGSAFFTALNDGPVSAAISFLRTLVFQILTVFILPTIWQVEGIWLSVVFSEALSLVVTVTFWICLRRKYHYC